MYRTLQGPQPRLELTILTIRVAPIGSGLATWLAPLGTGTGPRSARGMPAVPQDLSSYLRLLRLVGWSLTPLKERSDTTSRQTLQWAEKDT
jgi:hypothetical protein